MSMIHACIQWNAMVWNATLQSETVRTVFAPIQKGIFGWKLLSYNFKVHYKYGWCVVVVVVLRCQTIPKCNSYEFKRLFLSKLFKNEMNERKIEKQRENRAEKCKCFFCVCGNITSAIIEALTWRYKRKQTFRYIQNMHRMQRLITLAVRFSCARQPFNVYTFRTVCLCV